MSRWLTPQDVPNDASSSGPKVLAAGLWRCTTSSLQIAFEELLDPPFRPSMHGTYIFTSMPLLKLCVRASQETSKEKRQEMVRQIFSGYNASSDYPGMAFADDLMEMYPDMKVVLNKRKSAEAWRDSANGTLRFFSTWKYALCCGLIPQSYYHWQLFHQYERLAKRRFGEDIDIWSEDFYEVHNLWIKGLAEKHGRELLEWEPSMGWEPLCEFLNLEVPQKEFPRSNDAAEINELKPYIVKRGVMVWAIVVTVTGGIAFGARWLSTY
ncbi:hypothetical protein BS50DRAFT_381384 [Corynespora cassiicola Philippines]|uniref:Uncharacterized protein n=1 Tax=Corynespora cassiicola Philippines TaxID=1448308 RepID=A0A2T2NPS2_CORCC|nr:hypothetical protein BS50DRAFT_381384 [Corynespora cassiicola Philippines]